MGSLDASLTSCHRRERLVFPHCNFARIHKALLTTPAAAGTADHVSGLEEIVGLLDNAVQQTAA